MDLLAQALAPIADAAWKIINDEARRVLKLNLAGRKLVDYSGPHGWEHAAVNTGRLDWRDDAQPGVRVGCRIVQPLVELRVPFRLDLDEMDAAARGAENPNVDSVIEAAKAIAHAEDRAIFCGLDSACIRGLIAASPHPPEPLGDPTDVPRAIVAATTRLRGAGVSGPYRVALGTRVYDQVQAAAEDGYPVARRIEGLLVAGDIVHAPAIDGGVLLSTRGGDYELTVGQDLSIGYTRAEGRQAELYLVESFTFRVLEATAAVPLR